MHMKPPKPANEAERQKALESYHILDTSPEAFYDHIATLASRICKTPMAVVTFIDGDRQWFKAKVGLDGDETSRDEAFCAYAIHQSDVMVVSDPTTDKRFAHNPLVTSEPNIRFYAGAPLTTKDGYGLGTLCVIDSEKRELTQEQFDSLNILRSMVVHQLELGKQLKNRDAVIAEKNDELDKLGTARRQLDLKHAEINELSKVLSHDLRAPLRGITSLSEWILEDHGNELSEELLEKITLIQERSGRLNSLLDSVIEYSQYANVVSDNQVIDVSELVNEIIENRLIPENIKVSVLGEWPRIRANQKLIFQIFDNLISNALKYQDKTEGIVEIRSEPTSESFVFLVRDNGMGIEKRNQTKIFDFFGVESKAKSNGSAGLGLPVVRRNVLLYEGRVSVNSTPGEGAGFVVELPRTLEVSGNQ